MITAGLGLNGSGGVAVVRDGRLELSVGVTDLANVPRLLADQNCAVDRIDEWAVHDRDGAGTIELGGKVRSYVGYPRMTGRVAAAYCTSPFAQRNEPATVLVWDECADPRLFTVDKDGTVTGNGAARPFMDQHTGDPVNLCFAGDRALDPACTSELRGHPLVAELWIPPFPDDSGAAIGAAAAHLGRDTGLRPLDWSIRLGPELTRPAHLPAGWSVGPCRPEELARMLHRTGQPVTLLSGRAKLGPQALGTRSILVPAVDVAARAAVNGLTGDGADRPLAALCLADHAPDVFDPGTPDPYQQYAHRVRAQWVDRVPAIAGTGGAARVQTVGAADDLLLTTILREYRKWSGIPLLCGTSAYRPGHGLIPGAVAAMEWDGIGSVWVDGILYRRVTGSTA
jgi:hypothetical protein